MKLCNLCHWLLQKRRWLILPAGLAILLLLSLLLPQWLILPPAAALLLVSAMLLVYVRDLQGADSAHFSRRPAPHDGQAEIVMVDASLVDLGTQLQAAAQPVNACAEMSMRMGSGALLLGTAMVFLADELPPADGSALLSAASQLNLRTQTLRSRSPVIDRGEEDGMRRVTIQDGQQERSYFMADAATVAAACGSIWEDRVRPMGQNDRERVLDAAAYMASGGGRVKAFATATDNERPIFLGLAALGDGLDVEALRDMQELRAMGLTLILRDDETVPVDIAALRKTLDIPDLHARPDLYLSAGGTHPDRHCLTRRMQEGESLVTPVRRLRDHFACMAHMLTRLGRLMGLALLCCCIAGTLPALGAAGAMFAAAYLSFGSLVTCRGVHWPGAAIAIGGSLVLRVALGLLFPEAAGLAGSCLCVALSAMLAVCLAPRGTRLSVTSVLPMVGIAAAALVLLALLSLSLLPAALLPMAFGAVCGGLIGTCFLLVNP